MQSVTQGIPPWLFLGCLILLQILTALPGRAADKSGVSPNTISLPKGPGSIEGLGESFQPTLNTGTAKHALILKLPPGVAGHQPELSLSYDGGGGNGPLGYGWSLSLPCVQRRTDKGIPTYGQDVGVSRSDVFINEMKEELVPQLDGFHFCKNEGAFVRYRQLGEHWEGTLPDGTRLEFGLTASGRIAEGSRVFGWLLERETDTRGNVIEYGYESFPGDENLNQRYLVSVRYGPGASPWTHFHFVAFRYEDRPDWFEDGRAGFVVRTGKRLQSIIVGTQGKDLAGHLAGDFNGDGTTDHLNRRYELEYLRYAGTNSHWSLLEKVTLIGADGLSALPPARFGYAVCNPPPELSARNHVLSGIDEPAAVMDNEFVDLVDLNADGLPDVLRTELGGAHTVSLNRGLASQGEGAAIQWSAPVAVDPGNGTAWNLDLASAQTHLADMDGDGLADLVHKSADETVFYFRNQGRLAWAERREMTSPDSAPPAPFGHLDVRTADLDFDKRIDIIQSIDLGGGTAYRIWFNLGGQTYSRPVTVEPAAAFQFSIPGVHIADANGDRVPDLLRVQPNGVSVAAGLGYGRFTEPRSMLLPDTTLDDTQVAKARLTDVNGDGLTDLVLERPSPGVCWYWLNLGNYAFSSRKSIVDLPATVSTSAAVRWADLNGNGTTDLVYADSQAHPRLQAVELGELLNGGLSPNTLIRIENGIGRVTTIEYAPSTRFALEDAAAGAPWLTPLPFPVAVVSEVRVSDSLGHESIMRFRYHDGYYDSAEKQFRGFAHVEQIDVGDSTAPTLVTRSRFDTGREFEAMKGKLLRASAEQTDGKVFWDEITTWATPPRTLRVGTNGELVRYAHPIATAREIFELGQGTPRRLETELDYDNFGNQVRSANYGIVEGANRAAFDDERISTTEFALNLGSWLIRHLKRQEISDENGSVISRTEFFYDDESFTGTNFGEVEIGNLTLRRDWFAPSDANGYVNTARTKYDVYGNSVALFDPLHDGRAEGGHYRELIYDTGFHTYPTHEILHVGKGKADLVFQAAYDEGLGTIISSTDFNGHTSTFGYDAFGRLVQAVRPGDTPAFPTAEYEYALAARVPLPLGAALGQENQPEGVVNYVETRLLDRTPNTAASKRDHYLIARQFVDGLGRKLMTRSEAEPAPGSSAPRVAVTDAVLFNARQQPGRVLNPFFTVRNGSLEDLLAFENVEEPGWQGQFHENGSLVYRDLTRAHARSTDYDATLRPVRSTNPDGTVIQKRFEPLAVRAFDENDSNPDSPHSNTPVLQLSDGLGRLIQVDEIVRLNDDGTPSPALRAWTTRYEYDLNDSLTRIRDSQNNIKVMGYDGLRRKVFMNDPDCGISTYTYDDASNLIETADAKGQRLTFTYDGVNRLLTEDYHDENSPEFSYQRTPDVEYGYDEPVRAVDHGDGTRSTARNTKGVLAYVIDVSGEEHRSYDGRGRVEWTVKRIWDPASNGAAFPTMASSTLVAYTTRFEYDALDRIVRMVYPDNDEVSYQYNARSLLERITGGPSGSILSGIRYLPSAQQNQVDYGNGVRTTYDYDSRLRLSRLLTKKLPSPAGPGAGGQEMLEASNELVHFTYSFDSASNVETIDDLRPESMLSAAEERRNSQAFTYDDLYRLTGVRYRRGPDHARSSGKSITYRYDRLGNLLAQTSDIAHLEKGLSVTDLGELTYGGSAGSADRKGRQAADPPGPHALTAVRNSESMIPNRHFQYDGNGNMTEIDGLKCTWDFKDRLVTVENETMRAEYRYDFADHRILKRVTPKPGAPGAGGASSAPVSPATVIYAGRHFEVRQHEQPIKYVFNGDTRVARITGSLSSNSRVQRLRLRPGWNLCSMAVDGASLLARPEIAAVYQWQPDEPGWEPVPFGASLAAGTVLWIKTTTSVNLAITGTYREPTAPLMAAGGAFLPGAGLEAWDIRAMLSEQPDPESIAAWHFHSSELGWRMHWPSISNSDVAFPSYLAPGQALFINAPAAAELTIPDPALRLRYYHQDHLGSSSAMTDAEGSLVEETAYYPFGTPRYQHRLRQLEEGEYQFTQKERDPESGLSYFDTRFLSSNLSRFIRVDVLASDLPAEWLSTPQKLNLYAYVGNNPLRFVDPTGMDRQKPAPAQPRTKVLVLYGEGMFEDFAKVTRNHNRTSYEQVLKAGYKEEAGDNAEITVRRLSLKNREDLADLFKGQSYDVIIYNGHGGTRTKEIFPGNQVALSPQDIRSALGNAKTPPKKMYFYGCNTAKSGFVRVLSELLPNTAVTGTGNKIAVDYRWQETRRGRSNFQILENRDHNITFERGQETHNVRKVDPKDLQNAGIR